MLETALLSLLLFGLIASATLQIVLRDVFSVGLTWADGLTRMIVLWLALLGALAAGREGRHITLGVVTRLFPARFRIFATTSADLFAAAVCGIFAWYALSFVRESYTYHDQLLGAVPAWALQAPMPVVFALLCARYLLQAMRPLHGH